MSKSLILSILSSLPSKREALSFLRKVVKPSNIKDHSVASTLTKSALGKSAFGKSALGKSALGKSALTSPRLCLVLVAEPALLLSSTHLKFLANNLTELCHLGILPLVVLDHALSTSSPVMSMSTSTRNPHNQNSNISDICSSSSIPNRKWPQINAAFQLAEQIDVADGPVRGIPIYADYAYTETHDHTVDNVTLDLSTIKSHLSSMLSRSLSLSLVLHRILILF